MASTGIFRQRHWRIAGAVAIAIAGLLTIYASQSSIVRDTALQVLPEGESPESPQHSLAAVLIFWLALLLSLMTAFYCALLDIRYIRFKYALARRDIFRESMGLRSKDNEEATDAPTGPEGNGRPHPSSNSRN